LQTFSNNVYAELSVEDLKHEYTKTKTELSDFRMMVEKGMIASGDMMSVTYFIKKLEAKLKAMKELLWAKIRQAALPGPGVNDTL